MINADKIKNIALVGHSSTGKTTLIEAILYNAKVIDRMGNIDDGNTVGDNTLEEIQRKITITSKIITFVNNNYKFNLIDTPGYADFIGETKSCLRVVEGMIMLINSQEGLEGQTENLWKLGKYYNNLPTIIFINKLDKEEAKFYELFEPIEKELKCKLLLLQLPIGIGSNFCGVVDLVKMKAFIFEDGKCKEEKIPQELEEKVIKFRGNLIESVAETEDVLLEKYLNGEEFTLEEIKNSIKKATKIGKFVPLICGSAFKNIGIEFFIEAIIDYLPSSAEIIQIKGINSHTNEKVNINVANENAFLGFVFKRINELHIGDLSFIKIYAGKISSGDNIYNANLSQKDRVGQILIFQGKKKIEIEELSQGEIGALVKLRSVKINHTLWKEANPIILEEMVFPEPMISFSVIPQSRQDEEKLSTILSELAENDLTFKYFRDIETKEMIISGIGDLHLEIIINRLKQRFGIETKLGRPKIAYKESIQKIVKVQGKYKRQSGGRGQYGDVWLEIQPLPRGKGFEFEEKIFGGAIPVKYVPAVEKGVKEAMLNGVLANYPVVDIKVILYDGSFHPVDSSDIAFKIAGAMAFRKGVEQAKSILLEPIMKVEIGIPDEYMGDITGDLNSRRGKILEMESKGKVCVISAYVPLAEMYKYATDLRSRTQGKGTFSMKFSHYEEVPSKISEMIILQAKKEKEEGKK